MTKISTSVAPAAERFSWRGIAHGDAEAATRLFDLHAARIYGLLRMASSSAAEAEEVLLETFAVAAEQASRFELTSDPAGGLTAIAVERLAARSNRAQPTSLEEARGRRRESRVPAPGSGSLTNSRALAGVTDRALATIVRTLEPRARKALVLRHVCGLEGSDAAAAIGCSATEVGDLVAKGLAGIGARIGEHCEREEQLRRQLADANPYKLRRKVVGTGPASGSRADIHTAVRGTEVHAEHPPATGLWTLLRKALRALADALRRRHTRDGLDDDVGDVRRGASPERTPTQKPIERPERTPSLTDYRSPRLTPGVAVYAMPRSTPGTERISNPRRPTPRGGNR